MKLSISWIFDHIDADWKKLDMPGLVQLFNKTAAEIEGVEKVNLDLDKFALAKIVDVDTGKFSVEISEWKKTVQLPDRPDEGFGFKEPVFLVKKEKDSYRWATLADLFCPKDGFVPALHVAEDLIAGGWKKQFQPEDYLLEVDNKTITHRPDMWSHRGFAREIAAMLNLKYLPFSRSEKKQTEEYKDCAPGSEKNPVEIVLKDQSVGKRFAGLYLESTDKKSLNRPSALWMAYRLACTGNRPINFLVDATNYVMLDVGQPMHAFDSQGIKKIEARLAKKGEKLTLLDGQDLELLSNDYVITDGKEPISLAGVMGGKDSGVSPKTSALFLESANFDATTIRKTAARFKTRTEASARFEKTLDPNQNIDAIIAFLDLLEKEGILYRAQEKIQSVGMPIEPIVVELSHDLLCKRLGAEIDPDFVVKALEKIEFIVKKTGSTYNVTVPTFRCSKDVTIAEDLIEEVGRLYGYDNVEHLLPSAKLKASDLSHVMRERELKQLCAHALRSREVSNYALFDEMFLKEIGVQQDSCVEIKNPFSVNWYRLVRSLVPGLLKNIKHNVTHYDSLRFFELARAWKLEKKEVFEQRRLAGIFFERKKTVDFYEEKQAIVHLFEAIDLSVAWEKTEPKSLAVWYAPYQTACLMHNAKPIGFAGKINAALLGVLTEGDAFVFELDADFLISYKAPEKKYKPVAKYPGVHRDVSMLVSLSVTVDQLAGIICSVDQRVHDVALVDFFQKKEWTDKKSITMRFVIQDEEKTLTGQQADAIYDKMVKKLEKIGATIR